MNVRWTAVLTGFAVDFLISTFLFVFTSPDPSFTTAPDLARTSDLILICLGIASTGVGGYVAGRMAQTNRTLHGLLVGVVGILFNQLGPPLPRILVIASGVACLSGALGGALSRFPPLRRSPSERG